MADSIRTRPETEAPTRFAPVDDLVDRCTDLVVLVVELLKLAEKTADCSQAVIAFVDDATQQLDHAVADMQALLTASQR